MALRTRLVIATWIAVVLIGGVCAAVTYRVARHETEELLDGQMHRVARIVAQRMSGDERPELSAAALPTGYETEDDLFVTVRNAAGRVTYSSRDDVQLPAVDTPGFGTVTAQGEQYKVFTVNAGDQRVTVAQSKEVRRESAAAAALAALLPVVLIIPALGLVITLVIRAQLRTIARATVAIAQRPPLALDPIPVESLPAEIRPLVEEINQLLVRQKAAIDREQHFLSDAAHALRTPLTALQLQSDVLDGSSDPEERARRRAELRSGIRRVVRLTGQLLSLARQESQDTDPASSTSLAEVLSDVHSVYFAIAAERGVTLSRVSARDLQVRGSLQQLILILGNLLDNALRYSPRDGILELAIVAEGSTVTIEVRDEGPGLRAEELERVFERFYRAAGDNTVGSGIGLATARSVAEQLGGRVWLENRADRSGIVARVTLALARDAQSKTQEGDAG